MHACMDPEILKVIFFGKLLIGIIKIVAPISLIVFGMFDFSKALISGVGDKKKSTILFFKRVMYGALIFLVPWIVETLIIALGNLADGVNFTDCLENATEEVIAELQSDLSEDDNDDDFHFIPIGGIEEDNVSTGYLKSPLDAYASQQDFIASIGDNSKKITYLNGKYHGGTDLPVPIGTNVYAMDGGLVYKVQNECGNYGKHIILQHNIDGRTYYTIYAHLDSISNSIIGLKTGVPVKCGTFLGKSGNTYHCGKTVSPHLHVGIALENGKSSKFPQISGDNSFLVGNFIGSDTKYSIVDSSNLNYYKECHYCS